MGDDVNLKFRLLGEDATAGKALNSVADKVDHVTGKMGGIGKAGIAVGTAIGGLATMGVSALGSLAESAIQTGLSTASGMQQASIGFETLLGSAQKSKDFVAQLSTFAANTPFEFPGLVDSSRTLLGVGVAAKDVVPMLTDFGDAAGALAIDQEHFQGIMMATSQAISAGKFQAGDLNQIMNNGLPVWSILAKSMHKTVPELREMSSKGQLLAKDVLPALQSQMHKDYGGAMAKQSQTLSGLWSTMQDTFSQGMAKVLQPLVPLLQKALPGAMNVLGDALDGISGAVGAVTNSFTDVGTPLGDFIGSIKLANGNVNDDSNNIEILGEIVGNLGKTIGGIVVPAVQALGHWWHDELMPALSDAADAIMPALRDAFNSVSQTLREHQDIIQYVKAAFTILGKFITEILVPLLGEVVKWIAGAVGPAFEQLAWVVSNIVIPAVKFLLPVFLGVVGGILHAAADMFGWVPGVGPKLKAAAAKFDQFKNDANAALNGIHDKHVQITFGANWTPGSGDIFRAATGSGSVGVLKPGLAAGGIVTRPMFSLIGEAGPEAVIPLSQAGRYGVGGGGGDVYVTVNGFMGDEDAMQRKITAVVRQATGRGYGTSFA